MCVKDGKFVLADRDHKRVYQLDKTGQEKARVCGSESESDRARERANN
jgi:hypothetical protein